MSLADCGALSPYPFGDLECTTSTSTCDSAVWQADVTGLYCMLNNGEIDGPSSLIAIDHVTGATVATPSGPFFTNKYQCFSAYRHSSISISQFPADDSRRGLCGSVQPPLLVFSPTSINAVPPHRHSPIS